MFRLMNSGGSLMVTFEGKEYFYNWMSDSGILYVYDSKQYRIGTTEVTDFDKESETMKKLIVLAFIEAVVKKQKAEKLLEGLF